MFEIISVILISPVATLNNVGKFEVIRKILFNLYHYMSYANESGDTSTGPLPIPLEVILKTDVVCLFSSFLQN